MTRAQTLSFVLLAMLSLLSLCSAARVHDGLFASTVQLPAGARSMLPTHLAEFVQRRSLIASAASYGFGSYGYGYGYSYGYGQ